MTLKPAWLTTDGKPWERMASRLVYENPWIKVTEHDAMAPTGRPALYGVVSFKNLALAILPIHDDGSVTLIGQSRFTFGDYSWELPEGGGPIGEDALENARRELLEEAGLAAGTWTEILRMQLSNSVTDEQAIGYLATDLAPGKAQETDDTELLAMARVPFREALDAAVAGHMRDALTVAMLLRGYHMAQEGALPGNLARAMLG